MSYTQKLFIHIRISFIDAGDAVFTSAAIVIMSKNIAGTSQAREESWLHWFFWVCYCTVSQYSRKYWMKLILMKSKKNINSNKLYLVLTEVWDTVNSTFKKTRGSESQSLTKDYIQISRYIQICIPFSVFRSKC